MNIWVADAKFGTHNTIGQPLIQILCNSWCETQITTFWSMEGDQYHNPQNYFFLTVEGQPNPSNEDIYNALSTEVTGDQKSPYKPIDVCVKGVKHSDKSQREYALIHISKEDFHSQKITLSHNVELLVRELMELFLSENMI